MEAMTLKEAAVAIGAAPQKEGIIYDVCTDTRKITEGCLFIAIKGENFDGHDFTSKALEMGAVAVVVEKNCGLGVNQLIVKSTRQALLDLAGYYRRKFHIPVVGITGSVGKTTTKDMTHVVVSQKYKTLKNEGNLNNEIGVPMTLFRLDSSYEAAVIEMGMSGFGEISRITAAVKPSIAIITNIGVSHIEKLGSRENILRAKLEITESMKESAPLILNADDDMLCTVTDLTRPIIYFGLESKECNTKAFDIEAGQGSTTFTAEFAGGTQRVSIPLSGIHNVYDALAAVSAGIVLGIDAVDAAKALNNYVPSGMRQRVTRKNDITIIEDCYNASPASQKAALQVLQSTEACKRIAVLGDMKELGDISEESHRVVGIEAAKSGVDVLICYGEMSHYTFEAGRENGIETCLEFESKNDITSWLIKNVKSGDAVLFKASRAMKLEEIINAYYESLDSDRKEV